MIPNKCMQVVNETIVGNYTESLLLYHPRPGHHGHILSCTATNNNIKKDITREDRIKLQIFCKFNFKDNFIVIFVYLVILHTKLYIYRCDNQLKNNDSALSTHLFVGLPAYLYEPDSICN